MKYLMTFSKYYYSEFNVEGFSVIETPQDLDEISNTIENYENPIEISVPGVSLSIVFGIPTNGIFDFSQR